MMLLLLWIVLATFTYFWLVPRQINFDFYTNWIGAHEMLRGANPYDLVFTQDFVSERGYPDLAHKRFIYPATITWILAPFWVLPAELAVSLWSGLQALLAMVLPLLVFHMLRWRIPPFALAIILLASTIGNYHTVNVYVIGQFTVFVLACLIAAWWHTAENRPWLAALALVGATVRLEGIFIAGAILLDLVLSQRYKIVALWAAVMSALFLLSVAQVGFWIPRIFRAVERYHTVSKVSSYPPEALGISVFVPLIVLIATAWGAVLFWQMRALPDRTRLPWRLSVAILTFLVILPQTHDYTLVYTFLPIWLLAWVGRQAVWVTPTLLVVLLASWVTYFIGDPKILALQQLVAPVFLGILLTLWWRQQKGKTAVATT